MTKSAYNRWPQSGGILHRADCKLNIRKWLRPQLFQQRRGGRDWGFDSQGWHSSGATNPCSPLAPHMTACARSGAEALPTSNGGVPGFTMVSFQTNSAALKFSLVSGSFWQLLGRSPKKKAHCSTLSCKHKVTRREKESFQSSVFICLLFKGKADKVPWGCSLHFSQITPNDSTSRRTNNNLKK